MVYEMKLNRQFTKGATYGLVGLAIFAAILFSAPPSSATQIDASNSLVAENRIGECIIQCSSVNATMLRNCRSIAADLLQDLNRMRKAAIQTGDAARVRELQSIINVLHDYMDHLSFLNFQLRYQRRDR